MIVTYLKYLKDITNQHKINYQTIINSLQQDKIIDHNHKFLPYLSYKKK